MNACILVIAAFLISMIFAGIIIPQILLIAFRKKLFDEPDERKIHTSSVPRLGGIAFMPVVLFTMSLILGVTCQFGYFPLLRDLITDYVSIAYGICAVLFLYLVGIADDLIGVKYKAKFIVQIVCAILFVAAGLWIDDLQGMLFLDKVPMVVGGVITAFAIVYIVNSINLIDGVDGLASGLCMVAFLYYGIIFAMMGKLVYSILAFSALGAVVQFFYYNVFGKASEGKKIFMGDTGSLTLGVIICFLSLKLMRSETMFNTVELINLNDTNLFILAFAPLIIPCFDVVRVYIGRVRHGHSPFLPDKTHIHHKLIATGMSHRFTMINILCVSASTTIANVILSIYVPPTALLVIDAILYTLGNIILSRKIMKRSANN